MLLCTFNALLNAYCSLHEKPIKIKCVDFAHQKIETIILTKIQFKLNFLNSHEKICISHGAYSFDIVQLNHLISNVSRISSSQNLIKVLYNFPEIKL